MDWLDFIIGYVSEAVSIGIGIVVLILIIVLVGSMLSLEDWRQH